MESRKRSIYAGQRFREAIKIKRRRITDHGEKSD